MQLQVPIIGLLCFFAATVCGQDPDTLFSTTALDMHSNTTVDQRLLPTVGNGHLAHVVTTDTLHINGLYNGRGGNHRARVPTRNTLEVDLMSNGEELTVARTYKLDVAQGIWIEEMVVDKVCQVNMYVYAHQTFNRLLVTQVHFKRLTDAGQINQDPITIKLNKIPTERMESDDLTVTATTEYNKYSWKRTATVRISETDGTTKSNVYMYYNDIPDTIAVNQGDTNENWHTYLFSVDTDNKASEKDFNDAEILLRGSGSVDAHISFMRNHTKKWERVWSHGRIETSNSEYNRLAYSSLYYLLSSLPTLDETNSAKSQYYGLSPDGLANGGQGRDFYGHVLPDMEVNMFPPILMFHPTLAKEMLSYRYHVRSAASTLAESNGYKYPYESGSSGTELTSVELYKDRDYVSGDVAFAARQYLSATRDLNWLTDSGRTLMNNVADFLQSRTVHDKSLGAYGIDDVSGPDDYPNTLVDNSVYTNIGASHAIVSADYANCLLSQAAVSDEWLEKANKMAEMFDHQRNYHPAYEGYKEGTTVNAGDVILVGYPHDWAMLSEVRENDLDIYEAATNFQVAPPTVKAMFAIGYLEVGNIDDGNKFFKESYDYTRGSFNVWTNATFGTDAVNYINGMATYLQSLVFGYGGLRLRHEQLDFDPILPQSSDFMNFIGLEYLGSEFDFKYDDSQIYVNVTSMGSHPLQITTSDGQTFSLSEGEEVSFSRQNGTMTTTTDTECSLKLQRTGGLVSSANQLVIYPITFLWVTLVALFCTKA
ncbi:protein-glucosylgalactosylhydroxylysine glucosidase-like isoform X2 [Glandiceps talaboti]